MSAFLSAYKKLNPAQREAVDAIEGPVMVVAGPGTGKTQILALRIANILRKTDTPPDGILALTFTEAGVHAMRKRLVGMIGSAGYQVSITTFHGFAGDVIRRHPDAFPHIIGSSQIDDIDRILLLRRIIEHTSLTHLKPFGDPYYHLGAVRAAISEMKRENATPERFKKLVRAQHEDFEEIPDLVHEKGRYKGQMKGKYVSLKKKIEKNDDLALLYERYEEALREERRFDYDDMIVEVIAALERDPTLLLLLQEQYLYILADEHQDANNAQNRLLELLGNFHDSPNLFVVGDAKQAIYRFQGASVHNFLYFQKRYPEARVVTLTENYRSSAPILQAAQELIEESTLPRDLLPPLAAAAVKSKDLPEIIGFPRPEDELMYVARRTKELIAEGVPPEEIAVLYRTNRDAAPLADVFEKQSIAHVIESDQNILRDPMIRKLLALLDAIVRPGSDEAVARALHADFLGIPSGALYRAIRASERGSAPIGRLLAEGTDGSAARKVAPQIARALALIETFAAEVPFRNPLEIIEAAMRDSGFLRAALASDETEDVYEKVTTLFEALRSRLETHRDATLKDLMSYLTLVESHNLLIKKKARGERTGRVRLMTAHRAKGLEFDHVFVIGVEDGHFGNRRSRQTFLLPIYGETDPAKEEGEDDENEDERRLLYVALTRARVGLTVAYAKENERGENALPSQFIAEMRSLTPYEESGAAEVSKEFEDRFREKARVVPPAEDRDYLVGLFMEQGLSLSALNTYLKSPWQFFYQWLLRMPVAPRRHMLYGDAMHDALRQFFDALAVGGTPTIDDALAAFEVSLEKKPIVPAEFDETKKRGQEALRGYLTARLPYTPPMRTEWKLEATFDIGDGIKIPLRGKLDRVERIGGEDVLRVTDYKTGRVKSRNEIEGKTKSSDGDLKRQLVFYRLLVEESGVPYRFGQGVLDFIEPDDKGRLRDAEYFTITDEEVDELRREVRRVAREILDLSFWDTPCDPNKCDYCDLLMRKDISLKKKEPRS